MRLALVRGCRCGHDKDTHAHYRSGTDCSTCDCVSYKGGFSLTLSVRLRPPVVIVTPDEIAAVAGPYVRPTHSAGTGGPPAPTAAQLVATPRRSEEPTAPARVRTPH